jgi:hypothetical protein
MYLTYNQFYEQYPDTQIQEDRFQSLVQRAETDINGLTFNRITAKGFDSLSDFQKSIIRRAVAMQVNFIHDNSELLDSPLSSYSISGVSMSFDKSKITEVDGVLTSKSIYGVLLQSGLCYRGL